MVVARASGMDLASILKRNTFLTLEVRPVGRGPRGFCLNRVPPRLLPNFLSTSPFCPSLEGRSFFA